MLLGEYEHTIDDKNRLTLPAKFRRAFEGGIVVTRGLDGCLWAWTPDGWENYRDSTLSTLHPLSQQGRRGLPIAQTQGFLVHIKRQCYRHLGPLWPGSRAQGTPSADFIDGPSPALFRPAP